MTDAQSALVALVRSGTMRVAQTGTRDGNIVARLVSAGVLGATSTTFLPSEETYHGRTISHAVIFAGLFVVEVVS